MSIFLNIILMCFTVFSFTGFVMGLRRVHKNPYGLSYAFNIIGAFVWADVVVFGPFWVISSLLSLFLQEINIFFLIASLFWAIRSIGEVQYWIHEQFAQTHRNPPHTLFVSRFIPHEASWIGMQIFWQCIAVFSIFASIFLVFNILTKFL